MKRIAFAFSLVAITLSARAQIVLQPGQAVMTCFSDNNKGQPAALNQPVAALFDIRNPAAHAPGVNTNWAPPHQVVATLADLKNNEVFGVALDNASPPNIYLTSTVIYKSSYSGINQAAPGTGQVFKIRASDGAALPFGPPLPNSGQGLGNIAFDATNHQFFVTNWADGKIYRLDMNGAQLGLPFDPFGTAPPTAGGFAPLGQRLWGVGVFRDRLYFGRWSSDLQSGPANTVWSVAINPITHDFGALGTGPDVTLPSFNGSTMPVSDIEFNATAGRMLIAEHGMDSRFVEIDTQPHRSRVLEYVLSGTTWASSSNVFNVGVYNTQTNAAGGVDYACPLNGERGYVVATGDALHLQGLSPDNIYGMQILPDTGGSTSNSYLVDADGNTAPIVANIDKTQIGDVDVYNTCDVQCFESHITKVLCAGDGTGDYFVTFTLKNLTSPPQTIYYAFITGLSPAGATASPNFINLSSTPVPPGGTVSIGPIRIHGAPPGTLSFTVSIHNKDLEECCAARITVDLPQCDCAQITSDAGPSCTLNGTITYTFTVQNLFNGPVSYVLLTPDTPATTTFSNYVFDISANPMAAGATRTFTVSIGPGGSQNVCFRISLHNANFVTCCSILHCVRLPRCIDWSHDVVTGPGTSVGVNGDSLVLSNPDGKPDCAFPLAPEDTGVDLHWLPIETASLAVGAFVEQRVTGTVDGSAAQTLTMMRTVRTAGGTELRTAFPALASTRYTYEFYRENALVGRQTGVPSDVPAIANQSLRITTDAHFTVRGFVPASQENGAPCDGPGPGCLFSGYTFKDVLNFAIANSPNFTADEIRVIPEDGRLTSTIRLTSLGFHAEGLKQVTLTELTVHPDRVDGGTTGTTTTSLNTNAADWQVVAPGAERPAQVVTAPPAGWPAPFTGSQWISVDATGFSISGTTQLAFQRCFCLGSSGPATLDLQVHADNEVASVLLNGHVLGGPGGAFSGPLLSIHRDGTIGDGFFVAGRNCVRVEINDFGGYTGINAAGTVIGPSCLP